MYSEVKLLINYYLY